jgi:hypothetical protein
MEMTMRTFLRLGLVVAVIALATGGCVQDPVTPPAQMAGDPDLDAAERELEAVRALGARPDGGLAKLKEDAAAAVVQVPGGSVDALQAAVAAAGPNGIVILQAGSHTESNTILITHRVTIAGEPGAILVSDVDHYGIVGYLEAAFHVRGADQVKIWGLDMRPADAIGGTAILLENANHASIAHNDMSDFQYGVMVEQSDHAFIAANEIECSPAWQVGEIAESFGVVVINGVRTVIAGNDVSQGLFGLWACDRRGTLLANSVHDGFVGIIFCKVPEGGFALPGGALIGAEFSAAQWKAKGNNATGNFDAGYLVIDGANNNLLVANNASNNGTYDIDLTADTYRFGFLTPASFENRVIAAPFQHLRIKNCGNDNFVFGGIVEPNDAEHPCN